MKITHLIALAACFVVLGVSAFAQRKTIDQREWSNAIYGKPINPWYQRNHRVETLRENFTDGVVTRSSTTVSESVQPDRHRYYSKNVENGTTFERDSITIGDFNYSRENGGAWKKIDLRKSGLDAVSTGGTGSDSMACSQFSVEPAVINGIAVKLYERVDVTTFEGLLTVRESRRWISEDGTPYREEEVYGTVSPRTERTRTTTTYEYDPRIKIEAPMN